MRVKLAEYSGFCFGVEKAITTTLEELKKRTQKSNIYSLGPLIHNEQVVDSLSKKGIQVIENIDDINKGTVIIRSHGVPKAILETARDRGINIIDVTCPFVKRIQNLAEDYYNKGYKIVIIGDPEHPEVIGINGWCDNQAIIINNCEDLEDFPKSDKICVVVQTTMPVKQYKEISEKLKNYSSKIEKFNTICLATKERQSAAKKLSQEVEAMVVIGGHHSSNTQKLVSICKKIRPQSTYHVETVEDLPLDKLKQYRVVGVTAGASTPKWIISEIIHTLNNI